MWRSVGRWFARPLKYCYGRGDSICLDVRLTALEVFQRLEARTDVEVVSPMSWTGFAGRREFILRIRGNMVRLRRRTRNAVPVYFEGGVWVTPCGSRVVGAFRTPDFVRAFIPAWTGLLLLGEGVIFAFTKGSAPWAVLHGAFMLGMLFGMIKWSEVTGRHDQEELTRFLDGLFRDALEDGRYGDGSWGHGFEPLVHSQSGGTGGA